MTRTITVFFQPYNEMLTFQADIPDDETVLVEDRKLSFCDTAGVLHLFNWDLISHVTESRHYPPMEAADGTP